MTLNGEVNLKSKFSKMKRFHFRSIHFILQVPFCSSPYLPWLYLASRSPSSYILLLAHQCTTYLYNAR